MSANPSVARGLLRMALVFVTHKILYFNAPNTQYTIYCIVSYIYVYTCQVKKADQFSIYDYICSSVGTLSVLTFQSKESIDTTQLAYTGDTTRPVYTAHPYYPLVHFRSRQYSVLILYQIIIHTCVMCVCVCVCRLLLFIFLSNPQRYNIVISVLCT